MISSNVDLCDVAAQHASLLCPAIVVYGRGAPVDGVRCAVLCCAGGRLTLRMQMAGRMTVLREKGIHHIDRSSTRRLDGREGVTCSILERRAPGRHEDLPSRGYLHHVPRQYVEASQEVSRIIR
jgi:hypothetical protein